MSRRFDNFQSRLAARPGASADQPADPKTPNRDQPDEDVPTTTNDKEAPVADDTDTKAATEAARKEGHAVGFKAANDRVKAVLASEHYAGREALATTLLDNDSMSAEQITTALAAAPKAAPTAALTEEQIKAAAEEGGRQEMKAALEDSQNSSIDASGGAGGNKPDPKAAADAIWTRAYGLDQQKGVN